MPWLKLPARKVGYRGFEPHSGLQVSKKQNVTTSSTCIRVAYYFFEPNVADVIFSFNE